MPLVLRRANVSRPGGSWSEDDFDVFDGDRSVGRVYCLDAQAGNETWFWGVSFQLTGRAISNWFDVAAVVDFPSAEEFTMAEINKLSVGKVRKKVVLELPAAYAWPG